MAERGTVMTAELGVRRAGITLRQRAGATALSFGGRPGATPLLGDLQNL